MESYCLVTLWLTILLVLRMFCGSYTAVLIASVLFGAVELFKADKTVSLAWNKAVGSRAVIGHRGCTFNAPENTLAAIREAHRLGVRVVELDVRLSLDNVPVLIHDYTVDRTTDGSGVVSEMSWTKLRELDASAKHGRAADFRGERIPRLSEALELCRSLGLTAVLDLCENSPDRLAQHLSRLADKYPDLADWVIVASFYPPVLHAVKRRLPQLSAALTHRPHVITYTEITRQKYRSETIHLMLLGPVADWLHHTAVYHFWWYFCGVNGVFINADVVSVEEKRYWQERDLDTIVWTVNSLVAKQYLSSIAVPYITDDCAV